MSSFLSTRDSVEIARKRHSGSGGELEAEEKVREHLSLLIADINAGKLGQHEIRQLTNFAQKLLNAHSAGEVIGKHFPHKDSDDLEVIVDSTPPPTLADKSHPPKSVTDNVNTIIYEIRQNNLTPAHLADLALAIVEACSLSSSKLQKRISSIPNNETKNVAEILLNSLQSSIKGGSSGEERSEKKKSNKIKWHSKPESELLVGILHKLKTQMALAPSGGSFTESIEHVIQDVDENKTNFFLYDAMILSICLIVTYQQWQHEANASTIFNKGQTPPLTKFDVLANKVIVTLLQEIVQGIGTERYSMEQLLRMTALVAGCEFQDCTKLSRGSIQDNQDCKEQEEIVIGALNLFKTLLADDTISLSDLKSLAVSAYKLQSTTSAGEPLHAHTSIWSKRKSSGRLMSDWSLRPSILLDTDISDNVEVSFITHLRLKLNGLQEAFDLIGLLHTTLKITELALDVLTQHSELTSFWAASLVIVVALVFDRIKSELYTGALDYKVLDSLINNVIYEAFNVSIETLKSDQITLDNFQFLTSAVTKYRLHENGSAFLGMTPKFSSRQSDSAGHHVSSPYAVIDFLEKSLQIMRQLTLPTPIEIKALGDYALSLQHFYGNEVMARVEPEEKRPSIKYWPNKTASIDNNLNPPVISASLILEHLDGAIEMARQPEPRISDLLALACFVTYLVEAPEKLARNEPITLPSYVCSLEQYEQRLNKLHKISHFIPRFDFIIRNLEKTRRDLKEQATAFYSHDITLLSLCIFVAYEWIRSEPLTVFSAAKFDFRAANIIYEAVQSTLRGIKNNTMSLEDLQNLSSVISNTADLRRASSVNISAKVTNQRQSTTPLQAQPDIAANDARVLELIDGLIEQSNQPISIDVEKLRHVLTSMQSGNVSGYLNELLVLSICFAASRRTLNMAAEAKEKQEMLDFISKPDLQKQDVAFLTLQRVVDGLRTGRMSKSEARNIMDSVVSETEEDIVSRHQLNNSVRKLEDRSELHHLLYSLDGHTSIGVAQVRDALINTHSIPALSGKNLIFLFTLGGILLSKRKGFLQSIGFMLLACDISQNTLCLWELWHSVIITACTGVW